MCSTTKVKVNLFIEIIKDHLIAANYFNTTTDEFINSIRSSVYFNVFAQKSLQFVTKLKEKYPELDEKKHTILIEKVIDSLNDYLSYILKYLEDYAGEDIFKVPRHVKLDQDKEINESLIKYSKEEDIELDQKLQSTREQIDQKKSYIKCLRKRSEVLEMIEMVLNKKE